MAGNVEQVVHQCSLQPLEDDHPHCTCAHRPLKSENDQWSLQRAVAYTFSQFLDKKCTKSGWSRPLTYRDEREQQYVDELIRYAAKDCLAVTKLQMTLERCWTREHLEP